MTIRCLLGLATLALLATPVGAQRILVNESQPVLAGTAISWQLVGLQPGQTVQLQAERAVRLSSGSVAGFRSSARFVADAAGRVDLARSAPLEGSSYAVADVRGMLWSMTQQPGAVEQPQLNQVALTLLSSEGKPLAKAELSLQQQLPTVQTRRVETFPGALFAVPAGAAKRPTLILLGGSEGGSGISQKAAHWASFGYSVLALPYYSPPRWTDKGAEAPELPELPAAFSRIPVERLQQVHDWLAAQPEADTRRIGLMGTSKGAEFALLAGVRFPWLKAIAAIVPSDMVWEGWDGMQPSATSGFSWQGEALGFIRYQGFVTGRAVHMRRPHDRGRAAATPAQLAAARIPVERIAAPLLLAGGGDDQLWASLDMAVNIKRARDQAKLRTVALLFPEAGHGLGGTGTSPTTHYLHEPSSGGGTPQANAQAQAETHAALLSFFAETLAH